MSNVEYSYIVAQPKGRESHWELTGINLITGSAVVFFKDTGCNCWLDVMSTETAVCRETNLLTIFLNYLKEETCL